jgi:proline iminopeptidase
MTTFRTIVLSAFLLAGCGVPPAPVAKTAAAPATSPAPQSGVKDGGIQMVEIDGEHHVWTKRVGQGPVAMLLLPGGPGCSHDYFAPFEDYLPPHGVQLVLYDPLGTGRSDRPDDPGLWRLDRFVGEVEQVRAALGLESIYLFGHSWGGIVAIEYALTHASHLRGMIVSNAPASTRSLEDYNSELLARDASPETLRKVQELEARGVHDGAEYDALFDSQAWFHHHMVRLPQPLPEPLVFGCFGAGANSRESDVVFGAHRSFLDGNLRDWDRWNDLGRIAVPTLAIGAKYDFVSPAGAQRIAASIPHARLAMTAGSHMSMYDDQEPYFAAMLGFVDAVEAARAR